MCHNAATASIPFAFAVDPCELAYEQEIVAFLHMGPHPPTFRTRLPRAQSSYPTKLHETEAASLLIASAPLMQPFRLYVTPGCPDPRRKLPPFPPAFRPSALPRIHPRMPCKERTKRYAFSYVFRTRLSLAPVEYSTR